MGFTLLSLAFASVAFVIMSRWRTPRARVLRRIRQLPVVSVANAERGSVRLEGRARSLGPLLTAPFSQQTCIAYEIAVYRGPDADRTPFLVEARAAELVLEDGTGEAFVHAAEVRLICEGTAIFSSGGMVRATPEVAAYLRAQGVEPQGDFENLTLYCTETRVADLAHVVVCGVAKREVDPNPAHVTEYRATPTRLVVTSPNGLPLLLADEASLRALW